MTAYSSDILGRTLMIGGPIREKVVRNCPFGPLIYQLDAIMEAVRTFQPLISLLPLSQSVVPEDVHLQAATTPDALTSVGVS